MKMTKKILVIALMAITAAVLVAGCKGGSKLEKIDRLSIDLSTLSTLKNEEMFTQAWQDLPIYFGEWPENIDWAHFNRATIRAKYFYDDGEEMEGADGRAMVSLIYDPDGDWRGPEMEAGPNTPLKAFNVGGRSGNISIYKCADCGVKELEWVEECYDCGGKIVDHGAWLFLNKPPSIVLFQNSNAEVAYIEVTEITFFREEG